MVMTETVVDAVLIDIHKIQHTTTIRTTTMTATTTKTATAITTTKIMTILVYCEKNAGDLMKYLECVLTVGAGPCRRVW